MTEDNVAPADVAGPLDAAREQLLAMCVGGCTCGIKSPDVHFHDARCHYRQAQECLENVEQAAAALTAQAGEIARIEGMLNDGQGDDDGPPILPKFEPGMSLAAKIEQCLYLLEKRRDVIAARENDDWRDDPSADERWNAGCDFALTQLCAVLKVDPQSVNWDAATETLDGDVQSVIHGILNAGLGEDWNEIAAPPKEGV
jgi:hypothetical protein